MIEVKLSKKNEKALQETYRSTDDKRLRARCQAILMASRKRPRKQIAEDLEIDKSTLCRWIQAYVKGGLKGLEIQWALGREPLISDDIGKEIVEWVKRGPSGCGLDRANWTYEELATYLYQQKGIKVKRTTMRDFCAKHHIKPYSPTYDYRKASLEAQEKAKEELAELKKKPRKEKSSC